MTTVPATTREVRLVARPQGWPKPADFEVAEVPLAEPGPGEVLVRNVWMSVDPYMRGRMNDVKSYVPSFRLGEVLQGGAVGRVVASGHPGFAEGEVQVRNVWMSVDPYMRGRMSDRPSYVPPFELGKAMQGGAVGEVVALEADGFAP